MKINEGSSEITTTASSYIRIEELRELLIRFDGIEGTYPEHSYEGQAVWSFINRELNLNQPSRDRNDEIREIEAKCSHSFPEDKGFGQWIRCIKCGQMRDSEIYKRERLKQDKRKSQEILEQIDKQYEKHTGEEDKII
jgi:hypothetical protein